MLIYIFMMTKKTLAITFINETKVTKDVQVKAYLKEYSNKREYNKRTIRLYNENLQQEIIIINMTTPL